MSTAVPLPLDTLHVDDSTMAGDAFYSAETQGRETQVLRRAVTERLEQHRRRRGQAGGRVAAEQNGLPGIDAGADAGWTAARPNRVADSVAARFAKSQSYREFLQQEAEAATRQAEAVAEIARRNAEAVAAAEQQLMEEMRAWDERQFATVAEALAVAEPAPSALPSAGSIAASGSGASGARSEAAEAGVLLPMPAVGGAAREFSVLAPSEGLREAAVATPEVRAERVAVAAVAAGATPVVAAEPDVVSPVLSASSIALALLAEEPVEPTTPIPANLIEFPRQLVAARKARPRLAEGPLREDADTAPERAQLRIFEVEANSFSTVAEVEPASSLPEWSSIRLDSSTAPHETAQPDAQVSLALPVYAAPVERRVMAAAVDACCVGTAFLLAVAAAGMAGDALPTGLFALGASAVTLLLFGVGYLLLSFTLSGQTVGMRYARIALCTFGDDNPTRAAMRRRLYAYGLSAVSLGLGFAWALLDDEKLGWHDRVSRMYQRAY